MAYTNTLCHFNPNHDPKTGRFSSGGHGPSYKNIRSAKISNIEKWGKNQESNILFVTGISGSGKSTISNDIATKNDDVIHLDGYTESKASWVQNKRLNKYLDAVLPEWRAIPNASDVSAIKKFSKDYWDLVDKFQHAVEDFSSSEYSKGRRVIVEGVQIIDDWFAPNHSYYKDKPLVLLTTDMYTAINRANRRDGITGKNAAKLFDEQVRVASLRLEQMSKFEKQSAFETGSAAVDRIINSRRGVSK